MRAWSQSSSPAAASVAEITTSTSTRRYRRATATGRVGAAGSGPWSALASAALSPGIARASISPARVVAALRHRRQFTSTDLGGGPPKTGASAATP